MKSFRNIIFLLIPIILMLIAEGSLRILAPSLKHAYGSPIDPETGTGYTRGYPFSYNKLHMREIDFPIRRPDGQFRILAIGDSITFGYGLPYDLAWPKILEKNLKKEYPSQELFVINGAGVGSTTHGQLKFFKEVGNKLGANIVIIGFCMNDVRLKTNLQDQAEVATGGYLSKAVRWRYYLRKSYLFAAFDTLLTEAIKRNLLPLLGKSWISSYPYYLNSVGGTAFADQAWSDTLQSLDELIRQIKETNAVPIVMAFPYQFQISDDPRDNIYDVDKSSFRINPFEKLDGFLRKREVHFVDLKEVFIELRKSMIKGEVKWDPLFFDPCHPNEMGQKLATAKLFKDLTGLNLILR